MTNEDRERTKAERLAAALRANLKRRKGPVAAGPAGATAEPEKKPAKPSA